MESIGLPMKIKKTEHYAPSFVYCCSSSAFALYEIT